MFYLVVVGLFYSDQVKLLLFVAHMNQGLWNA